MKKTEFKIPIYDFDVTIIEVESKEDKAEVKKCSGILFLNKRIKFYRPDGTQGGSPGCGSILVAYGQNNLDTLKGYPLQGKLFIPQH